MIFFCPSIGHFPFLGTAWTLISIFTLLPQALCSSMVNCHISPNMKDWIQVAPTEWNRTGERHTKLSGTRRNVFYKRKWAFRRGQKEFTRRTLFLGTAVNDLIMPAWIIDQICIYGRKSKIVLVTKKPPPNDGQQTWTQLELDSTLQKIQAVHVYER